MDVATKESVPVRMESPEDIALADRMNAGRKQIITELQKRKGTYGLASLCIGGGQGIAAIFERV